VRVSMFASTQSEKRGCSWGVIKHQIGRHVKATLNGPFKAGVATSSGGHWA